MIKFKDFFKGRTSIFALIDKRDHVIDRYAAVTFGAVPFGRGLMELIDKNVRAGEGVGSFRLFENLIKHLLTNNVFDVHESYCRNHVFEQVLFQRRCEIQFRI